jgi:hypothetical protein
MGSSPGVKRPGRETDRSLPSSAEVKNGGTIPPLPDTSSWHSTSLIKHRDNFTFLPLLVTVFSLEHLQFFMQPWTIFALCIGMHTAMEV